MKKSSEKKKGNSGKSTAKQSKKKVTKVYDSAISKEIVGICMIGISILILIGIFTDKSGVFGEILRSVFIGLFGVGGYIIPILAMILGVFYILGDFSRLIHTSVYTGALILMLITFFHILFYGEDMSVSLLSTDYMICGAWYNGGYIGALLSYVMLHLVGIYGTYVLLAVLLGIWALMLTQFPVLSWFYEKYKSWIDSYSKKVRYSKKESITRKRKKALKAKSEETISSTESYFTEPIEESPMIQIYDATEYVEPSEESFKEEVSATTCISPSVEMKEATQKVNVTHPSIPSVQIDPETGEVRELPDYQFPPITLLNKVQTVPSKDASRKSLSNAKKLEETLASFGVEAKVTQIHKGPSVTRYELQPKQGVKVSKIVNLSDDIALNLAAPTIRIEAPIPGKAAVGIEVANDSSEVVYLRDVIDSDRFLAFPSKLAFALGKDITGKPVIADIGKMPHILIAGATGSGKSVCINTLVTSIIYKAKPSEVKLIMIDPKVVELSVYNGIPHLLIPVVTDPKKAAGALFWAVNEMTRRYNLFAENNVRDMKGYNDKQEDENNKLPQIVIIIDELADLMMTGAKEVEDAICRLAQMARAAGIHLVIATQRPSVDVITGVIKANIPSRLAFAVSSGTDSRTILDMVGAEKLLGKGDMLFYPVGESKPIRIQGAFISDKEVESIVNTIKTDGIVYEESVIQSLEQVALPAQEGEDEEDELLEKAITFAVGKEKLSISMLQRYFRIGFNRAARIMDALESRGIVGPDEGSKPRKVL